MRLNTNKYYTMLKEYYLSDPNYKIENDPTLTFQEFLLYWNLKDFDLNNKTFDPDDFEIPYPVWMNDFVAHFFYPVCVKTEWKNVLSSREKSMKYVVMDKSWKEVSPYKELYEIQKELNIDYNVTEYKEIDVIERPSKVHSLVNKNYTDVEGYLIYDDKKLTYQEAALFNTLYKYGASSSEYVSTEEFVVNAWLEEYVCHYFNLAIPTKPWLECIQDKSTAEKNFDNTLIKDPTHYLGARYHRWYDDYPFYEIVRIEEAINVEFKRWFYNPRILNWKYYKR